MNSNENEVLSPKAVLSSLLILLTITKVDVSRDQDAEEGAGVEILAPRLGHSSWRRSCHFCEGQQFKAWDIILRCQMSHYVAGRKRVQSAHVMHFSLWVLPLQSNYIRICAFMS